MSFCLFLSCGIFRIPANLLLLQCWLFDQTSSHFDLFQTPLVRQFMFGHIKNTPITHTLIFTCLNSVRFKGTIGSYTFLQIKKLLLIQKSLFQPCFPSLFSLVRTRARAEIYKSLWELNPVCIQTFIINTNFSDHSITHSLLCTTGCPTKNYTLFGGLQHP